MKQKWTMKQAWSCLIGSVVCNLFFTVGGYALWKHFSNQRLTSEKHAITFLIQTGPSVEALPSSYFVELLDLSVDRPTHLYALDLKKGEETLLASPLIAKASLKRIPPHTLYIDYEVRTPIACLKDYENIGIDRQGYLFPLAPFLKHEGLPEIYLGLPPFGASLDFFQRKGGEWNQSLKSPFLDLAFEVMEAFGKVFGSQEGISLCQIDVSKAFSESLGTREIVLMTEERLTTPFLATFPKIVRLSPKEYAQQLSSLSILCQKMRKDYQEQMGIGDRSEEIVYAPRIVDLRISKLAFVENR